MPLASASKKPSSSSHVFKQPRRPSSSTTVPNDSSDTIEEDTATAMTDNVQPLAAGEEYIRVCVRIRPLVRTDRDANEINAWDWGNKTLRQVKFPPSRPMVVMAERRRSTINNAVDNRRMITSINTNSTRTQVTNDVRGSMRQQNNDVMSASGLPDEEEPRWRPYDPLLDPATGLPYVFDHLFNPESSNEDIYNEVVFDVVSKAINGYHGSIFTYGQTSSGKTYTMTGTRENPGIIPLTIFDIFDRVEEAEDRDFTIRLNYMEVYKEQVKDLLSQDAVFMTPSEIRVLHDPKSGKVNMVGLKELVSALTFESSKNNHFSTNMHLIAINNY